MTGPAIFRSVSQALFVAYAMDGQPVSSKGSTQIVIEALKRRYARFEDAKHDGSLNFAGLSPLEVRAQCAMVRGAVDHHCDTMERAAIVAMYGQDDPLRVMIKARPHMTAQIIALAASFGWGGVPAAIVALRDGPGAHMTIDSRDARTSVVWHLHSSNRATEQTSERSISAAYNVPKTTLHRNIAAVGAMCTALRRRACQRLEPMFVRDGVVDAPDDVDARAVARS